VLAHEGTSSLEAPARPEATSAFDVDPACEDSASDNAENPLATHTIAGGESAAGTVIGPYHLIHPIGQGGMGEVWLAEQKQPVRRRVALKLIKAGMDIREVVARFESGRQALALMERLAPEMKKPLKVSKFWRASGCTQEPRYGELISRGRIAVGSSIAP
jgi:hypothetical protein